MADKKEKAASEGLKSEIDEEGLELLFGHKFTTDQLQQSWEISQDDFDEFVKAIINRTAKKAASFGISKILAGYTYLGQMITHDIVEPTCGKSRDDFSAELNLACLYPDLSIDIERNDLLDPDDCINDEGKFILDKAEDSDVYGTDLLRDSSRAMIPDSRQDENILISQLHLLWQKVHNFFVDEQVKYLTPGDRKVEKNTSVKNARYYRARILTTLLFQRIVLEDYLYQLIEPQIYKIIVEERAQYLIHKFAWRVKGKTKVPLEFSNGAFRFGHAMVRNEYVLSKGEHRSLEKILRRKCDRRKKIHVNDLVDWRLFFDKNSDNPNKAARVALQIQDDLINVDSSMGQIKKLSRAELSKLAPEMFTLDSKVKHIDSSSFIPEGDIALEGADADTASTCYEHPEKEIGIDKARLIESMLRVDMEASRKLPQASIYMEIIQNAWKYRVSFDDYMPRQGGRSPRVYLPKLLQLDQTKFDRSYDVLKLSNDDVLSKLALPSGLLIDQLPIPFSVFMMREAELLPLDWRDKPESVSFSKRSESLGPICSFIVAEVLMHSISENDINVFMSSHEIDEKIGGVSRLYLEILQDQPSLEMVDLLNIIKY